MDTQKNVGIVGVVKLLNMENEGGSARSVAKLSAYKKITQRGSRNQRNNGF